MLRVLIINFLILIPLVLSQQPGRCPIISGVSFNPYTAAGFWYRNRLSSNGFDNKLTCETILFSPLDRSNYTIKMDSISTITNTKSSVVVEGNANGNTYKYHVPLLGEIDIDAYVLGTDDNRWRILWGCMNHGNTHTEVARVYTRQRIPDEDELERFIDQSFKRWGLQKPKFTKIDQNC
ncbi:uncharacterized protein LOC123263613 [Cotesia glomerata]|uniref:Uncharacterized protein n=1 Tax=Cotesia glomerata TaxID=32391 RepID=A0AAV7I7Y4_COTGL|nr:uncharacterized protein LOC123263613 [Cotesia glomerata]KAH0554671.1 hypothetical protein KQX54_012204 [Cotesia glomerata]